MGYVDALCDGFEIRMGRDVIAAESARYWLHLLSNGEVGQDLVDLIGAPHRSSWDLFSAYAFYQVIVALTDGQVLWSAVWVGETPLADKYMTRMETSLNERLLPPTWSVSLDRNTQNMNDGLLRKKGVHSFTCEDQDDRTWRLEENAVVPIEIGTTRAMRTYFHLFGLGERQRVARWPYGSKNIHLLLSTKRLTSDESPST